jgi:hypothetical protein
LVAQVALQPRPDPERWKTGLFFYLVAFAFLTWAVWKGEWSLPALLPGESWLIRHRPAGSMIATSGLSLWVTSLLSIIALGAAGRHPGCFGCENLPGVAADPGHQSSRMASASSRTLLPGSFAVRLFPRLPAQPGPPG